MEIRSSVLLKYEEFHGKKIKPDEKWDIKPTSRQEKIPGFNQSELNYGTVNLIGAGGLGSEIGEGLVRKGLGFLNIFDEDTVELSNLNRQRFYEKDLGKNK